MSNTIYQDERRKIETEGNRVLMDINGTAVTASLMTTKIETVPEQYHAKIREMGGEPSEWGKVDRAMLPPQAIEAVKAAMIRAKQAVIAERERQAAERKARQAPVVAACPDDHVAVTQQNWSNGDLMSAEYQTADGVKVIASDQLDDHGVGVWYLPVSQVDAAREKAEQRKVEAAEAAEARKNEWRSPRGLTLNEEMDRPDSDY